MNRPPTFGGETAAPDLPVISNEEPFVKIVKKLSFYFVDAFLLPSTFEQLRTTSAGSQIRILVDHLATNVNNPAIVNALLTLKWHFSTIEPDDRGLNNTRAQACEIVAWRFLTRMSERDAVDFCLYDIPDHEKSSPPLEPSRDSLPATPRTPRTPEATEYSRLLPQFRANDVHSLPSRPSSGRSARRRQLVRSLSALGVHNHHDTCEDADSEEEDPTSTFSGLNALEIAAIADAKRFLSQPLVQKIIFGIWSGEIVFWEALSVKATKKPRFYNKGKADPFSRLRVPRYIKTFEVAYFFVFLMLFYGVLIERNPYKITFLELLLYIWITAFAYDEVSEYLDAGLFYAVEFWNTVDLAIILVALVFFIVRVTGLIQNDEKIIDTAFDILSLEALFLVPRICSVLSVLPYFGRIIPCLKAMTRDFLQFLSIVGILYLGFLTSFCMLARDHFTAKDMSWILIKVFFGSSYLGFDVMNDISPLLGPPLMLIFVTMSQILLITALISILSDSFSRVTAHAKEEYLFVYSVYVLEASTSNRLTHFYPPLNLIPLLFLRPLRLFLSSQRIRHCRIVVLKTTHAPIVALIWIWESLHHQIRGSVTTFKSVGPRSAEVVAQARQRPFLLDRSNTKTTSQNFSETDGEGSVSAKGKINGKREINGHVDDDGDGPGLEAKVEELGRKIEELTALIMAQQRNGNGNGNGETQS